MHNKYMKDMSKDIIDKDMKVEDFPEFPTSLPAVCKWHINTMTNKDLPGYVRHMSEDYIIRLKNYLILITDEYKVERDKDDIKRPNR